ncbi:MAG: ArnT family glycosyltransferase [Planctomycetota bacterium]|jgi:4-amino-4-deoxy-L-arabinose transferase-like glycosyltransferase
MNKKLITIIFLTVAVRLAAIFILGSHITPEVWEYDEIAQNIMGEKGYVFNHLHAEYRALGYPLYPVISALVYAITHNNYFALELLNVIASAFIVYLIFKISAKIYGRKAGLLSAFLVATHPGLIVYSTKLHELTLVVFFACFIFWYIISRDMERMRSNVIIGLVTGLSILLRPTLIFFLAVYLLRMILIRLPARKIMRSFLIAALVCACVVAPWIIKNYTVHKQWTFITTSSAEHFWRGNNAFSSGTSLTKDNKNMFEVAPKEFVSKLYLLDEIGQYNLFYAETLKFIKSDPRFFARMIAKKIYYFWWFSPQTGAWYAKSWKDLYLLYYVPFFIFFLSGLLLSCHSRSVNRSYVIPLCVFMLLISLAHSLYYIEIRHRWMIEPFILVIASFGVVRCWDVISMLRRRSLPKGASSIRSRRKLVRF